MSELTIKDLREIAKTDCMGTEFDYESEHICGIAAAKLSAKDKEIESLKQQLKEARKYTALLQNQNSMLRGECSHSEYLGATDAMLSAIDKE